ncbi:MAG: hypothetical protein ACI4NI_09815 [Candidatus Ornithospirochaeta sp.]
MKRRILSIIAIVLILLSISCDSSIKKLEEGNINYNIYPYLEFELSYDSTYYIAYVVEGAKVTTISIPGEKHTDYGAMPVKVFGGFRNPEDSKNLETVYIDINVDKIADDAFEYAENLEEIIVTGAEEGSNWTKLPPSLKRKGYHFEGWKVGDTIYDGESIIIVDPDTPIAEPYFVELEHHDAVNPTCTTHGSIEHWKCPECGKLFTDDRAENSVTSVSVSPLGHLFPLIHVDRVEPTCQREGNVEYWRCDRCMETFSDEEGTIPSRNVVLERVDHQSDGNMYSSETVHYHKCRWCGAIMDEEEHIFSQWIIDKQATEHTKGLKHADCSICGYRKTVEIPEHDHYDYEPLEKVKHEASCLKGAYYIEKCGNPECGEELKVLIEEEPALGHRGTFHEFVDSTCTETGTRAHIWCDICNAPYENIWSPEPMATIVIPMKAHEYSSIWTIGEETHYHLCITCETARKDEEAHVYRNIVNEKYLKYSSTCQHANQYVESCVCGKEGDKLFESGEVGEHKYTVAKPYDSEYHYYHCEYCDAIDPESKEKHSFIPSTNGKICELCKYEIPNIDGGFDFPILDATPLGHISVLSQEGTVWTFIFVNEKTSYPPKELIWYVDGVEIERKSVEGISDYRMASFSVNAEYPMTYKVMCKYTNDAGARSDTIVIDGGVK